jgi:hypothetical protein
MSKKKRKQDTLKSKAVDDWDAYVPNDNFYIAPERMDKFTWQEGDLVEVRKAKRRVTRKRTARQNG